LLKKLYADPRSSFLDDVKQWRPQPQVSRDTCFRVWLQEKDPQENHVVPEMGCIGIKDNGRVIRWLVYAEPLKVPTQDRRSLKEQLDSLERGSGLES
jgi:hypothetical protein